MGTFTVTVRIGDPQGQTFDDIEALVDTGSTYTFLPESTLRRLGVAPTDLRTFVLADGRRINKDMGETRMRLAGEEHTAPVIFGEEGTRAVLGATAIEIFNLAPEPSNERLIRVAALLIGHTQ